MADDLEALRVHLGLSAISILGDPNSGAIALLYAERYSNRVDGEHRVLRTIAAHLVKDDEIELGEFVLSISISG